MKKQLLKSALIAVAGVGILAGSAMATSFTDYNNFADQLLSYTSVTIDGQTSVTSYEFTFDLDQDNLYDNNDNLITIGATDYISNAFLYIDTGARANESGYQFVLDLTGTPQIVNSVINGYTTSYSIDSYLNPDHELIVTVTALSGQIPFFLQAGKLSADASPVPEPTTMLLFGTGIVGLARVVRKQTIC
ncbi:MAG: PEP-CTERM sorting domain-containing protein [Desulfobulbus sp.]|nr:PEP-CTERM sorting domain-containing protein [Desulfobulbus sp.]